MNNIIRTYEGKLDTIIVQEFTDGIHKEYHVSHSGLKKMGLGSGWYLDKVEAIKYAQFLAGKY